MSIEVKSIDVYDVKDNLKRSPKIIRDYVKSLENVYEFNKENLGKAISKLRKCNTKEELESKISKILDEYGCLDKGGENCDEVIENKRNKDLVKKLIEIYTT
jgi:UDP-N-acetylglucosamine:LPS N-acetylglucosamine transferase